MLFNSLTYLIFLPLVVFTYYLMPAKYRWCLLLACSYIFYMCWKPEYILLIITSTLVVFYTGKKISESISKKQKNRYLLLSIFVNLGILFFFKYYNFSVYNLQIILDQFNIVADIPVFKILLPVGISFYTFQAISYTADLYLDKIKPEKHLGYFALYITYFPQLVAGPIERYNDLMPQFKQKFEVNYPNLRYGINKILLGFFKKVVVADTLAIYVDYAFMNAEACNGLQHYLGLIFFAVQMFCDFSGYSDIAIGSARLMGIKLTENFNKPFKALSINDYWQRWHISLTNWIRDYIFYPIMYSRPKQLMVNTMIVFLAIGIWHGANVNYIIFGLIHGALTIIQYAYGRSKLFPQFKSKFGTAIRWLFNLHLLIFSAVFFRATSFDQATIILSKIFTDLKFGLSSIFVGISPFDFFLNIGLIVLLGLTALFNKELRFKKNFVYIGVMLMLILLFGQNREVQFIYFQF
ncbi:MAG: MBOAT family protein [Flavobacteriales bacterium]|nr:MBOAT family protein [Flavobacteriales bacterium]